MKFVRKDINAHINVCGVMPKGLKFFASSHNGIYYFSDMNMVKFADGMRCFGISKKSDIWYFNIEYKDSGDHFGIYCLQKNVLKKVFEVERGCHQIDFLDGQLHILDTYNNRIITNSHHYYPAGKLHKEKGRYKQKNYKHFNSIYKHRNKIYLLAHNVFNYSSKNSQIYVLDSDYKTIDIINFNGRDCHNIYIDDENFLVCNSADSSIIDINSGKKIKLELFLRGLAISDKFILVGGSYIERDKTKRLKGKGAKIFVLDRKFIKVGEIELKAPLINDIRLVEQDCGMSDSYV